MTRWLVLLCAVVVLLAVPVGAFSLDKMPTAEAAETVVPTYGAPAYVDGSPLGGGDGYSQAYSAADAKYVVSTAAGLKSALASATSGQVVYVADGATITLSSTSDMYGSGVGFYVKPGVILAGGRGRVSNPGIIRLASGFCNSSSYVLIKCGTGADVCGLHIDGPQDGTSGGNAWLAIEAGSSSEIHNNEIHGFGYGGVRAHRVSDVWVHHNYIHHIRQEGYGYPLVVHGESIYYTASMIAEGNVIDYGRHFIAASHGRSSYIFRYNQLGANCTNSQIDCHGQNEESPNLQKDGGEYIYPAGDKIEIYNNTSLCTSQPFVVIRGIPYSSGYIRVHHNWSYLSASYIWRHLAFNHSGYHMLPAICQTGDWLPEMNYHSAPIEDGVQYSYVRMADWSNWWGTTAPPASTNSAPLTPAAPQGTASGQTGTSYTYSVKTTDPDGDSIAYTIDWGDGSTFTSGLTSSGTTVSAAHSWTKAGTYSVKVRATDSKGNSSSWSASLTVGIVTTAPPESTNSAPLTPAAPEGMTSGKTGTSYTYSVKTTDPDGDSIAYTIDWGDGSIFTSGLTSSGTSVSATHSWAEAGTYSVKVRGTDSKGNSSSWSASLTVQIAAFAPSVVPNNAPAVPVSPSGVTGVLTSYAYLYSAVTTDPDGDALSYTFNWGDGTSTTVPEIDSGTTAYAWHAWNQPGTYPVRVSAADSEGSVSDWSDAFVVTVVASAAEGSSGTGDTDFDGDATGPVTGEEGEHGAGPSNPAVEDADNGSAPVSPDYQIPVGAHGPGLILWLMALVVMVGAAVFLTGAIVRECVPKPPRGYSDLRDRRD